MCIIIKDVDRRIDNMEVITSFALTISAVTLGLTEVIKKLFNIPKDIIPLVSMGLGVVVSLFSYVVPEIQTNISVYGLILSGIISGLMASGMWETFKKRDGQTGDDK